jgi:hypothetical protein
MSRPIAHNRTSEPINGSIVNGDDVGNIVYTVDGRGNDYYNGYADRLWVPSADGAAPIVFVTDTFTQGYTGDPAEAVPLFFACAGTSSAAVIYTANRLPGMSGQDFTTIGEALDYVTRNGYFILEGNDPFQGINADNLALDLDAAKMSSYPQTGTTWYDLSGNQNSGTLTNGPTWNSNGWFEFDGVDDYITTPLTTTSGQALTIVGVLYSTETTTNYRNFYDSVTQKPMIWWDNLGKIEFDAASFTTSAVYRNKWTFVALSKPAGSSSPSYYVNGELVGSGAAYTVPSLTPTWFNRAAAEEWLGNAQSVNFYSRALSTAEIKQNYFGSPIVTDGLIFAVDANNIISYPKSGTTAYDLTGSNNGTLTNGVGYLPNNGGTFDFDGTDDYIDCGNSSVFNFTTTTISCWFRKSQDSLYKGLVDKGRDGYGAWSLNVDEVYSTATFKANISGTGRAITALSTYDNNTWTNVVGVFDGTNLMIYQNGVLSNSASYPGSMNTNSTSVRIGAANDGLYYNGDIANAKIYNRALSAAEIQQNYQSEQYRFEGPVGPVTNGLLLYWDAGNLDSYPGTGTTIYDLSGNGNNGTLYNGVGYNQVNGGVLTFDGVDDIVYLSTPNLSSTNNTVMGASRYSGGVRGRMINAYGNNWLVGNWNNSTENYYAEGSIALGVGPSDTNWRIYSALGDVSGDSYSLYVNNSLSAGPSNGGSAGPNGITVGGIGLGIGNGEYSTGQFSFVLVYNRLLTVAEMTQNYNYFKGRFGL